MAKLIRLDKFLAEALDLSRSDVKKYISAGRVSAEGEPRKRAEWKLDPSATQVFLDGEIVAPASENVYYLLHKPAGYVSATEDSRERTIMELLPKSRRDLFPVGRLDKDTEGLLLVTDDGALAHRLLSPRKHVDKTYYVAAEGILSKEAVKRLEEGVDIGEEKGTLPAKVQLLDADSQIPGGRSPIGERKENTELLLTIHEGKFHQVKRMLEAVDSRVLYLRRISMGQLVLPSDLKPGEYREILKTDAES